jgi:hypothetical protein
MSVNRQVSFIPTLTLHTPHGNPPLILTFDLETKTLPDGTLSVVLGSVYDGYNSKSFYINDYDSPAQLLQAIIRFILTYSNAICYAHNFSKFDGVFLLKELVKLGEVSPLMRNDQFINLTLKIPNPNYISGKSDIKEQFLNILTFRDSILLIPSALSKLCKSFEVTSPKTSFDFNIINTCVTKEDFANIRNDLIAYCERDTVALHQLIIKFNHFIIKHAGVSIFRFPTIPSVALATYRSKFIPKHIVPKITGNIFTDLKASYYGAIVDVYTAKITHGY